MIKIKQLKAKIRMLDNTTPPYDARRKLKYTNKHKVREQKCYPMMLFKKKKNGY